MKHTIKEIQNYYGCLKIKSKNNKFYWGISGISGRTWSEISKELYDILLKEKVEVKEKQNNEK